MARRSDEKYGPEAIEILKTLPPPIRRPDAHKEVPPLPGSRKFKKIKKPKPSSATRS